MLDSDLAKIYGCKNGTKEINQAVKNNLDKFPDRFCFKIASMESKTFLVKLFDQKMHIETRCGKYKNPTVFTEQGIYMLATILKTKEATKTTISIMDTFVMMRKFINENKDTFKEITTIRSKLLEHDDKINELFDKFDSGVSIKQKIFFNGQIYDSYSLIIDILNNAKENIII